MKLIFGSFCVWCSFKIFLFQTRSDFLYPIFYTNFKSEYTQPFTKENLRSDWNWKNYWECSRVAFYNQIWSNVLLRFQLWSFRFFKPVFGIVKRKQILNNNLLLKCWFNVSFPFFFIFFDRNTEWWMITIPQTK